MDKKYISFKFMLILTIPIFLEMLLQLVVGYSDQFMMKKYPEAVNGITNANIIINMIINVFTIFAASSIILITQYKGAKLKTKETRVYSTTFFFNLFLSVVLSILILVLSRFYLKWIKVPSNSYNDSYLYTLITGGLIFFQALSSTLSAFLKANNYMKESMIINMIVNVINIVGNLVLINVFSKFNLEVVGVAISSSCSRIIGFILMFIVFKKKVKVSLSFNVFKEELRKEVKKLIRIGAPSGGEGLSYNFSQVVIQIIVNSVVIYYGNNVGLGNIKTYASMFALVTYLFTSSVSQAMQVLIGRLLGARDFTNTDKLVKKTLVISVIASTTIAILFFLLSDYCFRFFDVKDVELLKIAKTVMFVEIFLEFGRAFNIVFVRALQTTGDIVFPTISAVVFCWGVAVLGSYLFASPHILNLGLVGVWLAMALDECIRAVIFLFRWKSNKWQKYNLVNR